MTPDVQSIDLAVILTAGGATAAAALIAAVIVVLKRFPVIGAAIDNDHENFTGVILSLVLVAYAYAATTPVINPFNLFGAFLAWIGVATLTTAANSIPAAIKSAQQNS